MRIHPAVASVVGQITEEQWGQVLLLPNAYGVVQVHSSSGNALQIGVGVLGALTKKLETSPETIEDLNGIADEIADTEGVETLILIVPADNRVHIVQRGPGRVYLKRESRFACLLNDTGSVTGEVKSGDTLLGVTSAFASVLSLTEFSKVFDHLPPSDVAEKLTLLLHEKEGGDGSSAIIFQVEHLNAEEEEISLEEQIAKDKKTSSITDKETSFIKKISAGILRRLPIQQTFLARTNKRWLLVSIVLCLMFITSVLLGINKQLNNTQTKELTEVYARAQKIYDEGVALIQLNPAKSRERLQDAKALVEPFAQIDSRSKEARAVISLAQQIDSSLELAMRITRAEPALFFDVSLLRKGSIASMISLLEDTLGVIDIPGRSVFSVSVTTKSGQIVGGGAEFPGLSHVAAAGNVVYTLSDRGIHAIVTQSDNQPRVVIERDPEWGTIGSMVSYAGNLYLNDIQKSRIWKYVSSETGFTERREYLNPDTLPDLTKTTSMAIDGSIWLATRDGKIIRFTQGKENTYLIKGVEPALGQKLFLYTDDTLEQIYVADADNNRVVVLDKEGNYLAQHVWETQFFPEGIVVSSVQKKILLLSQGMIYSLDVSL